MKTGIERALAVFDNSPTKLAAAMGNGTSRQNIELWVKSGRVPPEHCQIIKTLTNVPLKALNSRMDWASLFISGKKKMPS